MFGEGCESMTCDIGAPILLAYIMPKMFSPRLSFMRASAMMLPLCLIWVCVACVSSCSTLGVEACEIRADLSARSIDDSHDEAHCPITATPLYALPERRSSIPHVSDGGQSSFASLPTLPTYNMPPCKVRASNHPCTSDPPLERLCTLRI